ncbi:helix-turn-helix domain-containing protein [Brevibacillus porteri]|uniref:helix-turn-helix domain-containing protein n=1 Tax=Brevibacillus porteri TaxID=2126350 RepID=UPI003D1DED50
MSSKIRQRRESLGLRQDFVAGRAGISKQYLCQIESGRRGRRITYTLIRKLANILQTTPDELMEEGAE